MTAEIIDLNQAWARNLFSALAVHHMRQASVCLAACAGSSIGTQALALSDASARLRSLAQNTEIEMRRARGAPTAIIALDEEPSGGLPCDMEQV